MPVIFRKLFRNRDGVAMPEYGLLTALLALPVLAVYLAVQNACAGALQSGSWSTANPGGMNPSWVCLGSYGDCGSGGTQQGTPP